MNGYIFSDRSGNPSLERPTGARLPDGARADTLLVWHERSRQRRALQALDAQGLKDLGLTMSDVFKECSKPFWRA